MCHHLSVTSYYALHPFNPLSKFHCQGGSPQAPSLTPSLAAPSLSLWPPYSHSLPCSDTRAEEKATYHNYLHLPALMFGKLTVLPSSFILSCSHANLEFVSKHQNQTLDLRCLVFVPHLLTELCLCIVSSATCLACQVKLEICNAALLSFQKVRSW